MKSRGKDTETRKGLGTTTEEKRVGTRDGNNKGRPERETKRVETRK